MQERRKRDDPAMHAPWPDAERMFPRSPEIMAECHRWALDQRNSARNQAARISLGLPPLVPTD